jgi:hypothetical protein
MRVSTFETLTPTPLPRAGEGSQSSLRLQVRERSFGRARAAKGPFSRLREKDRMRVAKKEGSRAHAALGRPLFRAARQTVGRVQGTGAG